MRTDVPEKLLALVQDIEAQGSANLTRLAADFCQHCDSRYGHSLAGPSRTQIMEIVRFMFTFEAIIEDDGR